MDQLIQENIQLKEEKMQFLDDVKLQPSWTLDPASLLGDLKFLNNQWKASTILLVLV